MLWLLLVFGLMTALHERLTVAWLGAFEKRKVGLAVGLGMALEAGTWAPIQYLNATNSAWVPVACTLGAGLGIWVGLRRVPPDRPPTTETECNGRDRLCGSIERELLQTSPSYLS